MSVKAQIKAQIIETEALPDERRLTVVSAQYLDGYRLALTFSDGACRTVDFAAFLRRARNPMATKYRELEQFKQFSIVNGNLNWNGYEMIFPVASLYTETVGPEC